MREKWGLVNVGNNGVELEVGKRGKGIGLEMGKREKR